MGFLVLLRHRLLNPNRLERGAQAGRERLILRDRAVANLLCGGNNSQSVARLSS
jgi:hypothetical protein